MLLYPLPLFFATRLLGMCKKARHQCSFVVTLLALWGGPRRGINVHLGNLRAERKRSPLSPLS